MRFSLILVVLLAATGAHAGGVDMSTQTCQDWLDADDDVQDLMIAWLRGYIAGRSTSTVYDASRARADKQLLKAYCQAHPQNGVISAASQWGR
jgi:acid stress chaperone HdeB